MADSLYQILNISKQDMLSRLQDLDVTSNNLSNVNTVGFKHTRANFQELLRRNEISGANQLSGDILRSTQLLTEQGALRSAPNALDLGIQGEGFFAVSLPDGRTGYTRDGQFSLDANHRIVSASGFPLVWQGQIPLDAQEVRVDPNGTIFARSTTTAAWTQAGTMQLNKFMNPTALEIYGSNVYLATTTSGAARSGVPGSAGLGQVQSHSLEAANVNTAEEMTHMISLQRGFSIATKTFQTTDQMISLAITMRK